MIRAPSASLAFSHIALISTATNFSAVQDAPAERGKADTTG